MSTPQLLNFVLKFENWISPEFQTHAAVMAPHKPAVLERSLDKIKSPVSIAES
jgi:hypothetical protein